MVMQTGLGSRITTLNLSNNASSGFTHSNSGSGNTYLTMPNVTCNDNGSNGFVISSSGVTMSSLEIKSLTCLNNAAPGAVLGGCYGGRTVIGSLTTSGNTTAGVNVNGATLGGDIIIRNSSIAETTKISETTVGGASYQTGSVRFENYLGVVGDCLSYLHGTAGKVNTESGAKRRTASGLAWTLAELNTTAINVETPLRMLVAKMAVSSGGLVTVKAWMRRSSTSLTASLVCMGGQIAGVPNDVSDSVGAAADTYEEQTITFTPTAVGVVEIEMHIYGGVFDATIDDLTLSQA